MAETVTIPKVSGFAAPSLFAVNWGRYALGIPAPGGKVWFVNSSANEATDGSNAGVSPGRPWSSLNYAFQQLQSRSRGGLGDVIHVGPNHVETITAAGGLDCDVANTQVIGWGAGEDRPQLNFTTAVGADCDIDAANITFFNLLLTGGIDALTGPLDVNASDFRFLNCETRDVTGQATDFIVTDANADRMIIDGWVHRGAAAAGADTAITIVGGDNSTIKNFWIDGNFAVACIENVTTAAVNLTIGGGSEACYARTRNSADVIFTAVATTTGNVGPNINARLQDNAANITEAFVGADMQFFQPIRLVNLDGESSIETNITASTDA